MSHGRFVRVRGACKSTCLCTACWWFTPAGYEPNAWARALWHPGQYAIPATREGWSPRFTGCNANTCTSARRRWSAGRASGGGDPAEGTFQVSTTTDGGMIVSAPRSALPRSIAPGGSPGPEANASAHQAASSEARPATDLSGVEYWGV